MDIQIDTREKQRAIRKILKTFDDNGVKHFSSKLLVGDYMSLDNPRLIIDRKQNLQELCGNVCQQHERFKRELLKAIDAGIQLVILVEHGSDIQSLCLMEINGSVRPMTVYQSVETGKSGRAICRSSVSPAGWK